MPSPPRDLEGNRWTSLRRETETLRSLSLRLEAGADSTLRSRVQHALDIGDCPRCWEMQADGVPCAGAASSCADCVRALDWVRSLRLELERILTGA